MWDFSQSYVAHSTRPLHSRMRMQWAWSRGSDWKNSGAGGRGAAAAVAGKNESS